MDLFLQGSRGCRCYIISDITFCVGIFFYRVIVKIGLRDKELQYKDAYTVKNADNIKAVGMNIYYNAWGLELDRKYDLIFKEGTK